MINSRRMLLAALDILITMEAFALWVTWEFAHINHRPCDSPSYIFCNETPSWLMTIELVAIFAFVVAAILFSIHGFRQLERKPNSLNIGVWVVLGLSSLPVIYFWYVSL